MIKRVSLSIHGIVQGVSYRYYTEEKANQLNLTGYVKNHDNGSVQIIAEGDEINLLELISWCKEGPPASVINNVNIEWQKPSSKFNNFKINY